MLGPFLLVFIAAADADSAARDAIKNATAAALGADTQVVFRAFDRPPGDRELSEAARAQNAIAAARVQWEGTVHARAAIHVYLTATEESHDDLITFETSDPMPERLRAVGFVIASYLLPSHRSQSPPLVATAEAAAAPRTSPAAPPRPTPFALDAFAAGAAPLGGDGSGLGGGVAFRWRAGARWGLRAAFRARTGSVDQAQASFRGLAGSLGAFRELSEQDGVLPALALRAEMLVLDESLTHFSSDDRVPDQKGRFLPGAAAAIELSWSLGLAAAVMLAVGPEAAFGGTDILLHQALVAHLPVWRGMGEAGFRVRF